MADERGSLGALIIEGLQEAVAHARGERPDLRTKTVEMTGSLENHVEQPPEFFGFQIADIRAKLGLSREHFARLLGSSASSVAAWESGRREPPGSARRLLQVADKYPDQVLDVLFMSAEEIGEAIPGQRAVTTRIERPARRRAVADSQG